MGISPAISALALVIIILTIIAAVIYEVLRRRAERRYAESQEKFVKEKAADTRINKGYKAGFKVPKGIVAILLIVVFDFLYRLLLKVYGKNKIKRFFGRNF